MPSKYHEPHMNGIFPVNAHNPIHIIESREDSKLHSEQLGQETHGEVLFIGKVSTGASCQFLRMDMICPSSQTLSCLPQAPPIIHSDLNNSLKD